MSQIEAIRELLYSPDAAQVKDAAKLLADGIPDELIYDVACTYLNGKKMDYWCDDDRRTPLRSVYNKYTPDALKALIKPHLSKPQHFNRMDSMIELLGDDEVDAIALLRCVLSMPTTGEWFFGNLEHSYGKKLVAIMSKESTLPEEYAQLMLLLWSKDKEIPFPENLKAHYSAELVARAEKTDWGPCLAALASEAEVNAKQWFKDYVNLGHSMYISFTIPSDDYPREMLELLRQELEYFNTHRKGHEIEMDIRLSVHREYSPKLAADKAKQDDILALLGTEKVRLR